jgi:erythromycin esterase
MFLGLVFLLGSFIPYQSGGLPEYIRSRALPLEKTADLDGLVRQAGGKRLVLLGEASHGTHEYYAWRDSISRELISNGGFRFIAVEGDWASLFELNRYVKNLDGAAASASDVLDRLRRWPQWMWANEEVVALAEWLRRYNDVLPLDERVGFYGMDVYDEWYSKEVLLNYLRQKNPGLYAEAEALLDCFTFARGDSWAYGRSAALGQADCTAQTGDLLKLMEGSRDRLDGVSDYKHFYLVQNALVIKNAEKFFRKSVASRDASSWNSRVRHMQQTIDRLAGVLWFRCTRYCLGTQYTYRRCQVHRNACIRAGKHRPAFA